MGFAVVPSVSRFWKEKAATACAPLPSGLQKATAAMAFTSIAHVLCAIMVDKLEIQAAPNFQIRRQNAGDEPPPAALAANRARQAWCWHRGLWSKDPHLRKPLVVEYVFYPNAGGNLHSSRHEEPLSWTFYEEC